MVASLKSFGCSFLFGTDLPDCVPENNQQHSLLTYPAIIAQRLGLPYACRAWGGIGNLAIMHRILSAIESRALVKQNLWIINWTYIDRFDYTIAETLRPGDRDDKSQFYFRNLQSDLTDKQRNLSYIYTAIKALSEEKIPFLMTSMDSLLLETDYHVTPGIRFLQKQVSSHITTFEGTDFLNWSKGRGLALGPTGHPLQQAHLQAADLLMPVIESILRRA